MYICSTRCAADGVAAGKYFEKEHVMQRIVEFLQDVQRRTSKLRPDRKQLGSNPLFSCAVQTLDGFRIGFMIPQLLATLCRKYGLDPHASEAILMQADRCTEPHVHLVGRSFFLPLGPDEGFGRCTGGTYTGPYRSDERRFELTLEPATPGKPFVIEPGVMHFFTPGSGDQFSAIAFVSPRIQRDDGSFDITRLGQPSISADGRIAVVEAL